MKKMLVTNSAINSSTLDMNFKPITSVRNPIQPQDAATRWYVDNKLDEFSTTLENPFAGYLVTLSGTEETDIVNLRPGSYIVTATPLKDGYPTATFSISKNSVYSPGHIARITGVPGSYTPEQLEVIWPPGNVLKLKKNGPGYDGDYVVDMNMKNTSSLSAPPEIPTDICDKAYVDRCIKEQLDVRFGGVVVKLRDTESTKVMNLRCGSYMIAVTPLHMDGAPTATFAVSKNTAFGAASVMKTSSCVGVSSYAEQLEMTWPENSMILLRKTGPGYDGDYLVDMNLKNFSSVPEALIPTDAATRAYVDRQIEERIQAKFGGVVVNLRDSENAKVVNLRPGSYVVAVTSLVEGGPTATFAVSKNSPFGDASIMRTSNCPGLDSLEWLELSWPENKMILLRKSGPFHDGDYMVDFNLKNISPTAAIPTLPEDHASKLYVDHQIQEQLKVRFGGIIVHLEDDGYSPVAALRPGSYLVTVTSTVFGGPTATFAISKSKTSGMPSIVKVTSCPSETGEHLELSWPENSKILLKKTGPFHDGDYLCDFNLKNFTAAPSPLIPTDAATREFVEERVRDGLQEKFGGINVRLTDDTFSSVVALKPGSYLIAVTAAEEGGPTSTFCVSKSRATGTASIVQVTSSLGTGSEERLELTWPPNGKLMLRKTGPFHDGVYLVDFNLKNFTSLDPAIVPTDAATRGFVREQIQEHMQAQFGGILVDLVDTAFQSVAPLRAGSYLIAVTSTVINGPTATFAISKGSQDGEASIVKVTSCPGVSGNEHLEMNWPASGKLQLRKTGPFYDGRYIVDLNLKNLTCATSSVMESETATRDFVLSQIEERMQAYFGGYKVNLVDTASTSIIALKPGSYLVAISSSVWGGPTATFAVSKASQESEASIHKVTSSPGLDGGEQLELTWPSNEKLRLRKTGAFHDGQYTVDLNLKNISAAPLDGIPTDLATREFVHEEITRHMQVQFGGIKVELIDAELQPVAALRPGSYLVAITSLVSGGPTATFAMSKTTQDGDASIHKVTSCPGLHGEVLELTWPPNAKVQLRKTGPFHDGSYLIDLNLKNFSATASPIMPSDLATREFVQSQISEEMQVRFSGIDVLLDTDALTSVTALKPGAYVIAVAPLSIQGGPAATFAVSKSDHEEEASIFRMTSTTGKAGETLELTWPANSKLLLRKSGLGYNGTYRLDLSLKNLVPDEDSRCGATAHDSTRLREVVKSMIAEEARFGGIEVRLIGHEVVPVASLRPGSYLIAIYSLIEGGPTATFAISKASTQGDASLTRLTFCAGAAPEMELELSWPPGERLLLRKTLDEYDGAYVIDLSIKNVTNEASVMPPDNMMEQIMERMITDHMKERFSGQRVQLRGMVPATLKGWARGSSYVLSVSPVEGSLPTATFVVSKGQPDAAAHVLRLTSLAAASGEEIQITWPSLGNLQVQKTGPYCDGVYRVQFNLKNQVCDHISELTEDEPCSANRSETVQGIPCTEVHLKGEEATTFLTPLRGSFTVHVTPLRDGPSASFVISRSDPNSEPSLCRLTSAPGMIHNTEQVEEVSLYLTWPMQGSMCLSKSSIAFDGTYQVKLY